MADTYHLSFSIGPVQTFVAQARRTRDLWAGSWLLSYLAESALAAAEIAGGQAIIPFRSPRDQMQVTAKQSAVGGMPNRFELVFTGDQTPQQQAQLAARSATEAFTKAWNKIAGAVFDKYLTSDVLTSGSGTAEIWLRQVDNFWELNWVIGKPTAGELTIGRLAAMRKHVRNVAAPPEPGVKCSLMPTLQELSGHAGPAAGKKQNAFWQAVARKLGGLDIGSTERLSAIALIKRVFPKVIRKAVGSEAADELERLSNWPSTAFVSAVPWLESLNDDARQLAEEFQREAGYERSEQQAAHDAGVAWAEADAPIWFASAIRNDEPGRHTQSQSELLPVRDDVRKKTVQKLLKKLEAVYQAAGDRSTRQLRKPVPYYALLLMDGDSMGRLLSALKNDGGPARLSECLAHFSGQVDRCVRAVGGRTVYAGGDDVLAMVPARDALAVAEQLRQMYQQAFDSIDRSSDIATISAAVVYAHWRYPLRQVLETAHHLLDDVAKDLTGRDAIAQGIILGSGLNGVWSVPWAVHLGICQTAENNPCVRFTDYLDRFDSAELDDASRLPFNASYLYILRERFGYLLGDSSVGSDGSVGTIDPDLLRDLAHAEYRRRLSKSVRVRTPAAETQPEIENLMSLSRRWWREQHGSNGQQHFSFHCDRQTFVFDGWRVARFVKQITDGRVDDHD